MGPSPSTRLNKLEMFLLKMDSALSKEEGEVISKITKNALDSKTNLFAVGLNSSPAVSYI